MDQRVELERRDCCSSLGYVCFSAKATTSMKGVSMTTDKKVDEGKGRLKEAAGSLTDDQDLINEGRVDRAKASLKDKVDHVAETVKGALDGERK